MMEKLELLKKMINSSNNIVFFSGAGVSTDSGLKDFRSENGIYQLKYKYPVEDMLSIDMFNKYPQDFYDFYRKYFNCLTAEPNITHCYLKKLEDEGKLKAIVTQNIDGLHTKAGNKNVYEIHGTIYSNHCVLCNKFYSAEEVFNAKGVPKCLCGGIIKPDVVLYGEGLPQEVFDEAVYKIMHADMLIVAGTSLTVQPASSLVDLFHGRYLVIINNSSTIYDYKADLVIHEPLKKVFKMLNEKNK